MVKIDSKGNEQIANALVENAIEKIKKSLSNNQPVFLVFDNQSIISGNTIEILATVGVGLDVLFSDVRKMIGVEAANKLFDSFIKAISDARQKAHGD